MQTCMVGRRRLAFIQEVERRDAGTSLALVFRHNKRGVTRIDSRTRLSTHHLLKFYIITNMTLVGNG